MIELTREQYYEVEQMASLNFTIPVIARKINIPHQKLYEELELENSVFRRAFESGVIKAKIAKEKAIFDKMAEGNITAIQIHDKKEKEARLAEAKQRIFGRS